MAQKRTQTFEADVALTRLVPYERNAREGDVGAIVESIEKNGFYGVILASARTGKIMVGNHRYRAALATGLEAVDVVWVDVENEEEFIRILLADNATNDKASYDKPLLLQLLQEMQQTADGLSGTGYDLDDMDELLSDLQSKLLPPEDFKEVDDEDIETEYKCPKCSYEWSGKPK